MKVYFSIFSSLLLTLLVSTSSFALESYYVVNPLAPKGVVELEYSRAQTSASRETSEFWNNKQNSSENDNIFKLNYTRRWNGWTLSGGTSFQTRDISSDDSRENGTVTGFGDVGFAAKSGTVYDSVTLTYGSLLNLSPGPAQYPFTPRRSDYYDYNQVDKTPGNNFSGIQSLSPFIGVESYVDEIAVGSRLLANFYSDQRVDEGGNPNARAVSSSRSFRIEGFAEIPVYNKLDIGLVAGFGRKDSPLGNFFEGGNEYLAQIYSQIKIDKEMAATVAWTSSTQKIPLEKSSNEVSIGFRRSM
jgi:hypothetical protein